MNMPGRKYSVGAGAYRYGFNGQENSDEIAAGLTTAMYWEYDSRVVHRWNVDPVPKSMISPYVVFGDNPIMYVDPLGNDWYKNGGGGYEWHDGNSKIKGLEHMTTGTWSKRNKDGFSYYFGNSRDGLMMDSRGTMLAEVTIGGKPKKNNINWLNLPDWTKAQSKQWKLDYSNYRFYGITAGLDETRIKMYDRWIQADKDYKTMSYAFVGAIVAPLALMGAAESGAGYYIYQGGNYLFRNLVKQSAKDLGREFFIQIGKNYFANRGQTNKMDWFDISLSTINPFKKLGFGGGIITEYLKASIDIKGSGSGNVFDGTKSASQFGIDMLFGAVKVGTRDALSSAAGGDVGRDFFIDVITDQVKFGAKDLLSTMPK
jgi:hypothetical protein